MLDLSSDFARSVGKKFVIFTSDQKYGIIDRHYLKSNNSRISGSDPGREKMKRLRLLAQSFGLILVTSLLISCGTSPVSVAPAATPTAMPEPPAATPTPIESQRPTTSSEVPRISPEELKDRLDHGEAILIVDSRSLVEFEAGHIAGAISVPSNEVESRLDELPRDQEIVLYAKFFFKVASTCSGVKDLWIKSSAPAASAAGPSLARILRTITGTGRSGRYPARPPASAKPGKL